MSRWRITVDQIAESGGRQRHDPVDSDHKLASDAVEDALEQIGLLHAEAGHYQITVTDTRMKP